MPSFQITLSPSRRAASRFVEKVRRSLQQALAEQEPSQRTYAIRYCARNKCPPLGDKPRVTRGRKI